MNPFLRRVGRRLRHGLLLICAAGECDAGTRNEKNVWDFHHPLIRDRDCSWSPAPGPAASDLRPGSSQRSRRRPNNTVVEIIETWRQQHCGPPGHGPSRTETLSETAKHYGDYTLEVSHAMNVSRSARTDSRARRTTIASSIFPRIGTESGITSNGEMK
jgi:hypothetical protein